jgi:Tol biopolymer transport system component
MVDKVNGRVQRFLRSLACAFAVAICMCTLFTCACTGPAFLEPQDMNPSWSPDSTQVVFVCYRRQRVETRFPDPYLGPYGGLEGYKLKEICISDLDGKNRRQLTDNLALDLDPSWSPDGTQIVFVSTRNALKGTNIYVMQSDGTNPIKLTRDATGYRQPRWSPDGDNIAFIRGGIVGGDIYMMAADGSQTVRLTEVGWVSDYDWSPDEKHIVFSNGDATNSELYIVNVENGPVSQLTDNQVRDFGPVWAPNGRRVAFMSEREGVVQVYVVDVQTLEETKISENAGARWRVSWSPNEQFLSYVSAQGFDRTLHILNLETRISTAFPNFEALDRPLWSPDSQYLIYERTEDWNEDSFGETKIWVLQVDDGAEWPVSSNE